jgi:hypothetical protein
MVPFTFFPISAVALFLKITFLGIRINMTQVKSLSARISSFDFSHLPYRSLGIGTMKFEDFSVGTVPGRKAQGDPPDI